MSLTLPMAIAIHYTIIKSQIYTNKISISEINKRKIYRYIHMHVNYIGEITQLINKILVTMINACK